MSSLLSRVSASLIHTSSSSAERRNLCSSHASLRRWPGGEEEGSGGEGKEETEDRARGEGGEKEGREKRRRWERKMGWEKRDNGGHKLRLILALLFH